MHKSLKNPYKTIKRVIDISFAIFGLVVASPVLLFGIVLSRLFISKDVIFKQQRIGYNGKPFRIYKIKTMKDLVDENNNMLPDEERLSSVGDFIRRWSIDELPQFINVLKGDLSFVGPRPHLWDYKERFSDYHQQRHTVLPGISGWAQINGRNRLSWKEKLDLDVWYVENWSLWLDIKIIAKTPFKILSSEGINEPGHATASTFEGTVSEEYPSLEVSIASAHLKHANQMPRKGRMVSDRDRKYIRA